jgi:hypothetical protein
MLRLRICSAARTPGSGVDAISSPTYEHPGTERTYASNVRTLPTSTRRSAILPAKTSPCPALYPAAPPSGAVVVSRYPRPVTWGFFARYHPWAGWNFGMSWTAGWLGLTSHWGYGWAGWTPIYVQGHRSGFWSGYYAGGWFGPGGYRPPRPIGWHPPDDRRLCNRRIAHLDRHRCPETISIPNPHVQGLGRARELVPQDLEMGLAKRRLRPPGVPDAGRSGGRGLREEGYRPASGASR